MSTTSTEAPPAVDLAGVRDEIEAQLAHAVETSRTAPDHRAIANLSAALRSVDEICMARAVRPAGSIDVEQLIATVWHGSQEADIQLAMAQADRVCALIREALS